MIFHVLGWVTVFTQLSGGAWLTHKLVTVGRRPYSWQQPINVAPAVAYEPIFHSHDYIGLI